MQKQMVQCEDGRRRQARIHGMPIEEGGFRIWKAGVRLKGKHVSGEAWYSHQTKTWYFIIDPEGKHSHLMDRIGDTLRDDCRASRRPRGNRKPAGDRQTGDCPGRKRDAAGIRHVVAVFTVDQKTINLHNRMITAGITRPYLPIRRQRPVRQDHRPNAATSEAGRLLRWRDQRSLDRGSAHP